MGGAREPSFPGTGRGRDGTAAWAVGALLRHACWCEEDDVGGGEMQTGGARLSARDAGLRGCGFVWALGRIWAEKQERRVSSWAGLKVGGVGRLGLDLFV